MKTRGLMLAKFAPFHMCHRYIIDTALKEVDELNIIMYDCPDITNIPLNVRAGWVRRFYPQVNVIEGWDAPNKHEDTLDVKRLQEKFVSKALNGKKITHFFSADYYGDHMSEFLEAINRRVDLDGKKQCGVRATLIRNDKFAYRRAMEPSVYRDTLVKVVVLGLPSKEQSRLTANLAKIFNTIYMEDNLIGKLEKIAKKSPIDFYKLAQEKQKLDNNKNKIYTANEYIFYDSSPLIDHLLSIATHNRFDRNYYSRFSDDMKNYDLVLINDPLQNSVGNILQIDHSVFLNQLICNLKTSNVNFKFLSGSYKEKVKLSEELIKSLEKKFNSK